MIKCKKEMPTCPVGCKYCMAQKIDIRSSYWKNQNRIGVNKSCVFFSRLPQDPKIEEMGFPWELLDSEFLGFQGITDCFWDIFIEDLRYIIDNVSNSNIKKLCLISKIPANEEQIQLLSKIKDKLVVCYSITGLDRLENTTTSQRISSLIKIRDEGIDVLPVIHPYIHGYCDIENVFKQLHEHGFKNVNWKGFRYNKNNMKQLEEYIPKNILEQYEGNNNEEEILVGNEYVQNMCKKYEMQFVDLKEYLHREKNIQKINYTKEEYRNKIVNQVNQLANMCVFSTSSSKKEVIDNCISRRLENNIYLK